MIYESIWSRTITCRGSEQQPRCGHPDHPPEHPPERRLYAPHDAPPESAHWPCGAIWHSMYKDEPPEATFSNIELPHTGTLILYQEPYKLIRLINQKVFPAQLSPSCLQHPDHCRLLRLRLLSQPALRRLLTGSNLSVSPKFCILQHAFVLIDKRQAFLVQKPHYLKCGEMQRSCHKSSDRSVKHMCT